MSEKWKIGRIIKNRYEIFDIKKGGMGVVFVCYDLVERSLFVLKTFRDAFLLDQQAITKFIQEATTWIHLDRHPNIVRAYAVEDIHFRPYVLLEYIAADFLYGLDLADHLACRRLSLETVLDFAVQFCEGMVYAREKLLSQGRSFVHADIKPSNILIQNQRVLKITDFGLSRAFDDEDASGGWGTLAYMSPEQFTKTPLDVRSDVYSFGCVLFEMIVGTKPFVVAGGKNPRAMRLLYREKHFQELPQKPEESRSDCPSRLSDLVLKCLEKNPSARVPDFGALKTELADIHFQMTGRHIQRGWESSRLLDQRDLINKGLSLIVLGKYQDSLTCLDDALSLSAEGDLDYSACCGRGYSLAKTGQTEKALRDYESAIRLFPDRPEAYNLRANLFNDLGDPEKALDDYDQALLLDDGYAVGHYNRGLCYLRLEQLEKALEDFSRAIALGHEESYTNRGGALQKLGRHEEALSDFHKAMERNPRNAIALMNVGSICQERGQEREALDYYSRAIDVKPSYLIAYFKRAYLLAKEGRFSAAIEDYEKALSIDPSRDEKDSSVHAALTKNELDRIYPLIYHDCGLTCLRIGDLRKGKEYLRRFLEQASPYYADRIPSVSQWITWIDERLVN